MAVRANLPVVGIAGIDADNAAAVIAAGADGVAVISALSLTPDPVARSAQFARSRRRDAGETRRVMTAIAMTIAGSDSSAGAGIEADLKTFAALGVYGAAIVTALTAQNTRGVFAIHEVPADFVTAQIDAVFTDLKVKAVKIGMLGNAPIIEAVAASFDRYRPATSCSIQSLLQARAKRCCGRMRLVRCAISFRACISSRPTFRKRPCFLARHPRAMKTKCVPKARNC